MRSLKAKPLSPG